MYSTRYSGKLDDLQWKASTRVIEHVCSSADFSNPFFYLPDFLTNGVGSEGKMSSADRIHVAPARFVADPGAVPTDFHIFVPAPEMRNTIQTRKTL